MRIAIILALALSVAACDAKPFIYGMKLFWHQWPKECNEK